MKLRLYSFIMLLAAAAGCGVFPPSAPPRLAAARTAEPVTPDGVAAEEVWSRAQPYPLLPPRDRNGGTGCRQPHAQDFCETYLIFEFQKRRNSQICTPI